MLYVILLLLSISILLLYLNLRFIRHPKMKHRITELENSFSNKYVDDE